jgi:hypothetical protein
VNTLDESDNESSDEDVKVLEIRILNTETKNEDEEWWETVQIESDGQMSTRHRSQS